MMRQCLRALQGTAALLALLCLFGGVPLALVVGIGWPLPTSVPTWHDIVRTLTQPDVPPDLIVRVLAVAVWPLWALFAAATVAETWSVVRRRASVAVPLAGILQTLAAYLVASVVVALSNLGPSRGGAVPQMPLRVALTAQAVPSGDACVVLPGSPRTVLREVVAGDSFWKIADETVQDPYKWPDLFEMNRGRHEPNGGVVRDPNFIEVGWEVDVPAPRVGEPCEPGTSPAAPPTQPSSPANTQLPPAPLAVPTPDDLRPPHTPPGTPDHQVVGEPAQVPSLTALPTGGLVAGSFLVGFGVATARARFQRRRRYHPAEPRPGFALGEPFGKAARFLRQRYLQAAASAQGEAAEPREADETPAPFLIPAADLPVGSFQLGVGPDGAPIVVDLAQLGGGLAVSGRGATDTIRALAVDALRRSGGGEQGSVLVAGADLAESLLPTAPATIAWRSTDSLADALAALEIELVGRSRLLDATGAVDRAALLAADPAESMPIILLVAAPDASEHVRTAAILSLGARRGIVGLVAGAACLDGASVEVDDAGLVLGATGAGVGQLRGGRAVRLSAGEAAECLVVLDEAEGHPPSQEAPLPLTLPPDEEEAAIPSVRAALLGGYRLEAAGHEIRAGLRTKAREVFAFLVLHPHGASTEALADAIWPDADYDRAVERLHTVLGNLRTTVRRATGREEPIIQYSGGAYRLDCGQVDADVWHFERGLGAFAAASSLPERREALMAAAAAYSGDLLDQAPYGWVEPLREDMRRRATDALTRLAELVESDAPDTAVDLLERAIRLDPSAEELYRRLIQLHADRGRVDAVRRLWRQLQARQAEIDLEPEEATEALVGKVLSRRTPLRTGGRPGGLR